MRKIQLPPSTIIKIRAHISYISSRITFRSPMLFSKYDKIVGTRQQIRFQSKIMQCRIHPYRIIFLITPIAIDINTLSHNRCF